MVVRVGHRQSRRGHRPAGGAEVSVVEGVSPAAGEFFFVEDGSALRAVHDAFPHNSLLDAYFSLILPLDDVPILAHIQCVREVKIEF